MGDGRLTPACAGRTSSVSRSRRRRAADPRLRGEDVSGTVLQITGNG
ncbi:hypothetical protein KCH_77050 [Kitasatospora cheerisanensis KCTC 2395]|uniref:Uncharacterized protein n=1 Tax=Kitasatospora cheerisanensis KCTC 2395 TaxID=1348663 RepID=A0A066YGD2_9ACTN|nr:hypothetical protein KCH_77050 [Kitasatospora cheerisanensis KCTC 2395]